MDDLKELHTQHEVIFRKLKKLEKKVDNTAKLLYLVALITVIVGGLAVGFLLNYVTNLP